MHILFDVTTEKVETVQFDGEQFEVFGHVQIIANDDNWQPPVPYPDDGSMYVWNEQTQSWEPVNA